MLLDVQSQHPHWIRTDQSQPHVVHLHPHNWFTNAIIKTYIDCRLNCLPCRHVLRPYLNDINQNFKKSNLPLNITKY